MRVLVTGSSGHVGGAIAGHLMRAGHQVVGLSRGEASNRQAPTDARQGPTGSRRRLTGAITADLEFPGLAGRLVNELPRCEAIVHAAAAIEPYPYAPAISLTNCLGTQQMLELAASWNVTSLIYLSSLPVIGRPLELPVTEQHRTAPPTAYHASKLYGEHLLALPGRDDSSGLSLRLTAPVGPGMPGRRIMSVFVARALAGTPLEVAGKGTRSQDYVDVRDVAAAVAASLERRTTGLLNIASGRCVSNLDLARRCVELLGSASEVRLTGRPDPEDGVRWEVSIAKAAATIDYRPRYALEDSIAAVADELRVGARG